MATQEKWEVDRRIPLALVATIALQSFAAIWWASSINSRMAQFEETVKAMADQSSRIVKLETQGESAMKTLERVEGKLDNLPVKK